MAEEHTSDTPSESTPPPGSSVPPVTEKPVPTRRNVAPKSAILRSATSRNISKYIVSVDDATGAIVKIEKLDEQTGTSRELTQEEYAAAYGFASYAAPYYAAYAASQYNPLGSATVQAYVKGIADYIKAFTGQP